MSSNFYLNAAIIAVSIFNASLFSWLGLTVLLNSDRRTWGIWITSSGLLLGALFFISHSAIVTLNIGMTWQSMTLWWIVGMVPVILLPFVWCLIILWYNGFWVPQDTAVYRRHRAWFSLVIILLLGGLAGFGLGVVLLIVPSAQLNPLRIFIRWSLAGIPLLMVGYSVYMLLCIGLALDSLRQPGLSQRMMGSLARQRARPYLIAATLMLLLISSLVTGAMVWLMQAAHRRSFLRIYIDAREPLAQFDLLLSLLIAAVVLLIGQAIVAYEVFTGKVLPSRGLAYHWYRAVFLSLITAVFISATFAIGLQPFYSLLALAMLVAVFYAAVSWRAYVDQERYIKQLRPFVSSQRFVEQWLSPTASQEIEIASPFRALCEQLLQTEVAYLTAVGPLAPLVGPSLVYPAAVQRPLPPLASLVHQFATPQTAMQPIDPAEYGGANWAIPLWSERGLIGLFLLGPKKSGSLYSQEEIEIVRVSGERLIDNQASMEMGRRLMLLQRQQLSQSQIIDQQTRRVLHDEILPSLQAAMISLSSDHGRTPEAVAMLSDAHKQISDLLHDMPTVTAPEVARLGLIRALRRAIDNELAPAFDALHWQISPEAEQHVGQIPTLTAEVIFYATRELIRNAARYGRGGEATRPLALKVHIDWVDGLQLRVEDNGVGFQTAVAAHRTGHGLALHSTMMAVVGGSLSIDSLPNAYTRATIELPLTAVELIHKPMA